MFDQVAKGYDRTNSVLSVGNDALWRIATVRAVAPKPGERILDLAAGTGTSSVALAKSGATVTAVDFSAGMIEVGRSRHPDVEFVQADVTALPFKDEFSKPPRAIFRAGYNAYLKYLMPIVVRVASSNSEAYDYLAESIREWPDQGTLSQWIRGAGFSRVAHRNLTVGVVALHRGRKSATAARVRRSRASAATPPFEQGAPKL